MARGAAGVAVRVADLPDRAPTGHWPPGRAGGTVSAMPRHAPAERPIPRGLPRREPATTRSGHPDVGAATATRADFLSRAALVDLQRLAGNAAVAAALTNPSVQRDDAESKGGTPPPSADAIDVVFVIQRPGDQYTKDLNAYVKSTLKGDVFVAVANLQEICEQASKLTAGGKKLRKIRFASHGQTVTGGVGMTPKGEKSWRYVKPDEVKAYTNSDECKALRSSLAKDAEVELWGCYVGRYENAGQTLADFWGAPLRASKAEMKIGAEDFLINGKTPAVRPSDVPKKAKKQFEDWLIGRYQLLRTTGEAPFLQTRAEQIAHMTEVFEKGGGKIRSRVVQEKGMSYVMRPGEKGEAELWEKFTPSKP